MKRFISVFLVLLLSFSFILPATAENYSDIRVIFTEDSYAEVGSTMTVDIEAMAGYDARIWECLLNGTVSYTWYVNYVPYSYSQSLTLSKEHLDAVVWVEVTCGDLIMESEAYVIYSLGIAAPEIVTYNLPEATEGEEYYVRLDCTDPNATFGIYYNPGSYNQFSDTSLNLTMYGEIEGCPAEAGTYIFTVCAYGEGGEGYMTYTLVVNEAPMSESSASDNSEESNFIIDFPSGEISIGIITSEGISGDAWSTDVAESEKSSASWVVILIVLGVIALLLIPVLFIVIVIVIIVLIVKKSKKKKAEASEVIDETNTDNTPSEQ